MDLVLQLSESHKPSSSALQLLQWVSPSKASIIIIIKACLLCNSSAMHHYQSLIKASQNPFKYPLLLYIVSHDQNYLEHWSLDPKVFVGLRAFGGLVADIPREKKEKKKKKKKKIMLSHWCKIYRFFSFSFFKFFFSLYWVKKFMGNSLLLIDWMTNHLT